MRLRLRWRWSVTPFLEQVVRSLNKAWNYSLPGSGDFNPEPGLYHYQRQEGEEKTRLHLRMDPDGHGTLLINANEIIHFNPTAALMTFLHLEQFSEEVAQKILVNRFQVTASRAKTDYQRIITDVEAFIQANGQPIHPQSEITFLTPFSQRPSSPYRMDLALTYRCNNACPHCYNARARSYPEMSTSRWKETIDRTWSLNIPHVVFTGGEPTLRKDLPELIRHAESLGQITGLNTNGRRLADPAYVQELAAAGLDHVQITLESHLPKIHDQMVAANGAWEQTIQGIKNAASSSLYLMTNTTMLQDNYADLPYTLDMLADLGVPTVGLNALIYAGQGKSVGTGLGEDQLQDLLEIAQEKTKTAGQRLIWYTPTTYCHFNPLDYDLGLKGCTAALYNMCVEPDGGVIPCQSYYHQLGHILDDPWSSIWEHDLALDLRERRSLPDECGECALLFECGGGCPLSLQENPVPLLPRNPLR